MGANLSFHDVLSAARPGRLFLPGNTPSTVSA
jgi:hypothetical protein